MFENLKKAIDKAEEVQAEKAYERAFEHESALRKMLTGNQWEKYTSGTLTREKALEFAQKKAAREAKKPPTDTANGSRRQKAKTVPRMGCLSSVGYATQHGDGTRTRSCMLVERRSQAARLGAVMTRHRQQWLTSSTPARQSCARCMRKRTNAQREKPAANGSAMVAATAFFPRLRVA